jgi:hypothetical protein
LLSEKTLLSDLYDGCVILYAPKIYFLSNLEFLVEWEYFVSLAGQCVNDCICNPLTAVNKQFLI